MFVGPDFIKCDGGEGFKLGDLIVNCGEDEETYESGWNAGYDSIIELDEGGNFKREIFYLSAFMAVENFGIDAEAAGWYDAKDYNTETWKDEEGNWKKVDSKISYEPGFGFQVNCKTGLGVVTIKSALAKEAAE